MIYNVRIGNKTVQMNHVAVGEKVGSYLRLDEKQPSCCDISIEEAVRRMEENQIRIKKEKEKKIWNAVRRNVFLPDLD